MFLVHLIGFYIKHNPDNITLKSTIKDRYILCYKKYSLILVQGIRLPEACRAADTPISPSFGAAGISLASG